MCLIGGRLWQVFSKREVVAHGRVTAFRNCQGMGNDLKKILRGGKDLLRLKYFNRLRKQLLNFVVSHIREYLTDVEGLKMKSNLHYSSHHMDSY